MLYDQARAHLQAAAAAVFARIDQDHLDAPYRLRPAFVHLREHLFDPDLQVSDLKEACGIRDNAFPSHFKEVAGEAPKAYLLGCRLEVATQLLAGSELSIGLIAELIGYASAHSFSAAFARWAGLRPRAFRERARAGDEEAPARVGPLRADQLRQAVLGALPEEEAEPLVQHLQDLYAPSRRERADEPWREQRREPIPAESEQARAEATWLLLRHHTFREAKEMLHRHRGLCSPQLADLLRRQGRLLGRRDRRRGTEVSVLALECVQGFKARWRDYGHESVREVAHLEARTWIWVANAYRLSLRLPPAERAFAMAEAQLPGDPDRQVRAELLSYQGALRWYQRRLLEGIELEERAIALFRLLGEATPLAEALLTLGGLYLSREEPEASLGGFREGLSLLDEATEPALVLGGATMLTRAYEALDRPEEARASLRRALGPAKRLGKLRGLRYLRKKLGV